MVCDNNYTVQKVLQRLQTDQFDDSLDENEETDLQDEDLTHTCDAGVESSNSDTDSSEDEQDSATASVATLLLELLFLIILHLKICGRT